MSGNVTKKDLIQQVCDRAAAPESGLTRAQVRDVIQTFLDVIIDELKAGRRIELRDFGVFEVKRREARTAQNPKTLEKVEVPPHYSVKFKAGRMMQEGVSRNTAALDAARASVNVETKPSADAVRPNERM